VEAFRSEEAACQGVALLKEEQRVLVVELNRVESQVVHIKEANLSLFVLHAPKEAILVDIGLFQQLAFCKAGNSLNHLLY
jgi:hypothetical protein